MTDKLRFGTGGMPLTTEKQGNVLSGIKRIRQLGLDHMELEFVYQVFIKKENAPAVKELAQKEDVTLTAHASYYVNLASEDKQKWHASINRVIQAAERGDSCGAVSVTYHSGFLQGRHTQHIFGLVKEGTTEILRAVKEKGLKIRISPELTGKPSQFGDLEELIKLVQELKQEGYGNSIGFCFDFAHKFARSDGRFNSYDEYMHMLEQIGRGLGEEFLHSTHIHLSGIEHSPGGEKNHLVYLPTLESYIDAGVTVSGIEPFFAKLHAKRTNENHFNWKDLLRALKAMDVWGYVVCESPIIELDALLMQTYYLNLD